MSTPTTKNITAATTRTLTPPRVRLDRERQLLAPGQTVSSPETRLAYSVERLLGHGGFGPVYLARRLGRSSTIAETVFIKAGARSEGRLREAYCARPLHAHP